MRLGINTVLKHKNPEHWAEILRKKGLQAACFPVNYESSDKEIAAYEKAFHDYDITIAEVGIWNSPFAADPKIAAKNQEICKKQLELANYVEAKCCVNVSGSTGEQWYGCYRNNYSEDLYKRNVEFIQKILDEVNPMRTFYTLEFMQWMIPDNTQSYQKLLHDINRRHFAVHMDPVNLVNSPKTAMFYKEYRDEAISVLGSQIKSCHLKDFVIEQGLTVQIKEVIPGKGMAEIPSYIKKINKIDKDMPMLLEHLNGWDEYERAIAYIKELNSI